MASRPNVVITGVLLGVTTMVLAGPLTGSSWWLPSLIAAGVAGLSALIIGTAVNYLPTVPAPLLATVTTVTILVGNVVDIAIAGSRANLIQDVAMIAASSVVLRLGGATVDRLTPVVNVSLIASITGTVVCVATVALLLSAHPQLSVWACTGIGAGLGYLEGVLTGAALRTGNTPAT